MNDTNDLENLKALRALRREQKKRPRMRQHGRALKKMTLRPILHIHKVHPPKFSKKTLAGKKKK